jgi:hypothetical protein
MNGKISLKSSEVLLQFANASADVLMIETVTMSNTVSKTDDNSN